MLQSVNDFVVTIPLPIDAVHHHEDETDVSGFGRCADLRGIRTAARSRAARQNRERGIEDFVGSEAHGQEILHGNGPRLRQETPKLMHQLHVVQKTAVSASEGET